MSTIFYSADDVIPVSETPVQLQTGSTPKVSKTDDLDNALCAVSDSPIIGL
jgi:hypothetical protein